MMPRCRSVFYKADSFAEINSLTEEILLGRDCLIIFIIIIIIIVIDGIYWILKMCKWLNMNNRISSFL